MSQLPGRPDLDQLRHQARELHRAAQADDTHALATIRQVSEKVTLSAAQLAIARDYGFPSWPKLRAEVAARRADGAPAGPADSPAGPAESTEPGPADGGQADHGAATPPPQKSWEEMREWAAELLVSRTGEDVAAWNGRAAAAGLGDEQALRAWLADQGVTGYAQALLVWERFGYPDFLTASADELIAGQYADRPRLRPILDAVLAVLPSLGPATVQARKTLVSLVGPRRTFAVVQATT